MIEIQPTRVFLSYSHRDAPFVSLIVAVLRAAFSRDKHPGISATELVFHDKTSIEPGEDWRDSVEGSIRDCQRLLLMWSEHSSQSSEVEKEYQLALAEGKPVVPMLLDRTPLRPPLERIHGTDLSEIPGFQYFSSHLSLAAPHLQDGETIFHLIEKFKSAIIDS